jgi:hydroxymethylglutaryl-CoA lyase
MSHTPEVTIVEVGPRDGLQNEPSNVKTSIKIDLVNQLSHSGLQLIEATSFVSPERIPQLADGFAVMQKIDRPHGVNFFALIPNDEGMQKAIDADLSHIAVFTAASETFNQHNIHCSIAKSIERISSVIALARAHNVYVRAYISCAFGCPYEGEIAMKNVMEVTEQLVKLGVDEISLADTIGVGSPKQAKSLIESISNIMPLKNIALHLHDTYGQAIANIYQALNSGISRFDSSVAGLGGCPYAKGATGNVATEDVLYLMQSLGIDTGVDINKIVTAGDMICKVLGRRNQSKVANALLARRG